MSDSDITRPAATLAEQQNILRRAITAIDAGAEIPPRPDIPPHLQEIVQRSMVDSLRFALADHEDEGCPALDSGVECLVVANARRILGDAR